MTKRDVAVWFCKVWALTGMLGSAFALMGSLVGLMLSFGPSGRTLLGASSFTWSLPHLGLSIFVWLFAVGIGTELAAEGEHGPPLTSMAEFAPMLLRCVGLNLFFSATVSLAFALMQMGYFHFFAPQTGSTAFITRSLLPVTAAAALQSIGGFLLAFTPRIRRFLGK